MLLQGIALAEDFMRKHPAARKPLVRWLGVVSQGRWSDIVQMRTVLPSADGIKGTNLTCFNIGGNKYRLLASVSFQRQMVVVIELLTHEQYTRKYVR